MKTVSRSAIVFSLATLLWLAAIPLYRALSCSQTPNQPETPVVEPQSEPGEVESQSAEESSKANAGTADAEVGDASASGNSNPETDDRDKCVSDAERIAELTESIESDQTQIKSLETELENPQSEYAVAEKEFRELDAKLDTAKEQLEKAKADSSLKAEQVGELESDVETLTKLWKLAKDRFDLAIEDRKTLKEQLYTLKHKLQRDQKALKILTEGPELDEDDSNKSDERDHHNSENGHHSSGKHSSDERQSRDSDEDTSSKDEDSMSDSREDEDSAEEDQELKDAREEAAQKEEEAREAQEETKSIEARLKDLQLLIAQEQKELNIAKKKVDLAAAAQQELGVELTKLQTEEPNSPEINTLKTAISSANQRAIQARSEVNEINERLNDHRAELGSLQSEHIIALHEAERKRREAQESEQHVADLKNPYTLRNMLQWLLEHGPRLALIAICMFVFSRAASVLANRSVQLVSKGSARGSRAERENRAKTLVGVFQNAASVGIFITGSLMILEELGANITVLMGGVAVIGLAVAFGAQNLIKDYFYGFVMLLENQYMLNDTIRIGGVTGQVERITLRMTVLRDSGGIVHFIPNGTINSVSNETHGWSRAVCEVGVGHQEDLEQVLSLLNQVSLELTNDNQVAPWLLEAPSEPSIENLGSPIVTLKLSVKTVPNKQGKIKQEWLRRIKRAFESHGIAAPYSEVPMPLRKFEVRKEAA